MIQPLCFLFLLFSHLCQRVGIHRHFQVAVGDVGVDLCSAQILMA